MNSLSAAPLRRRLRRGAAAPLRGIGALALAAALLAPAGTAFALSDDDPASSQSEEIGVRIPDRSGIPPTDSPTATPTATPTPPPTPTPAPHHGGASGELPDTGGDWSSLWPGALLALGLTVTGTVLIAAPHRRTRQRVS
ncbi:hypothetical protein QCD70_16230 [Agreia sp. PsM10]|uniref:hypothetical protein n=1 Tax=Agreia sp. PsM10 TaxID=3030533 RepID=UPI00263B7FA9|nr:hypothetical protein [Agreia sp. PsM10]MDN4641798.1 hypothetical protein [Agreia sp. PsM10]